MALVENQEKVEYYRNDSPAERGQCMSLGYKRDTHALHCDGESRILAREVGGGHTEVLST